MGIFSTSTQAASSTPAKRRAEGHAVSIVAPDMVVSGNLKADGVIRIEGRVAGNVSAGDQILLTQGGVVEGDLETREAVLAGEVHGTVSATDRVEVQATARVLGDIVTPRLLIQEGGQLNGAIRMESGKAARNG
jgi:cytoskeletal protein CcmA (bactofilin family)